MIYLKRVTLPIIEKNRYVYPGNVVSSLALGEILLRDITVFYGSNGSGKSTMLNLIANKIGCERTTTFDPVSIYDTESGKLISNFDEVSTGLSVYYETDEDNRFIFPADSRLISSQDIFQVVNGNLSKNRRIANNMKNPEFANFQWDDDEGSQIAKRKYEREAYARDYVWRIKDLRSNGQEAFDFLDTRIGNDGLYLIDEPENCLSPILQKKLAELISTTSRYCGCQYVISTHSPFFLSLQGAKIYNLDNSPATCHERGYELEHIQPYFELFD
ncbi:MAG: AAA family ATPase, partial [Clostridia bacterium]|nr:AAA family ATPase [Clostridia bacterium]